MWHLPLLHLSVDVPFTCPDSWGYYAILENAIENDRLLAPAVGSEVLLWDSTGMWQRCCTHFLFVKLKKTQHSWKNCSQSFTLTICLRHIVMNFNCLKVTLVLRYRKHLITIVFIEFHTQFITAGISRIYSLSCGHDSHPTLFKSAYCYLQIPDKVSYFRVRSDRSVSTD